MEAREFLKLYRFDERVINGRYFGDEPLPVEAGDTVAVVLFNLGGPDRLEDIEPFLYNLFMDPVIIDLPFGGIFRHWLSRLISSRRSRKVAKDYEKIGGRSPINRLTREQASALEAQLNESFAESLGVRFRAYIAMRYLSPTTEEAAARMAADGVTKVVLLPLYPHYSKTTTGSSLVYWWMLGQRDEIRKWPTAYVYEYAAHPGLARAVNERIDEALARFPEAARDDVQLIFSAHGTPLYEMKKRRDPYCCLIHSTVEQVMRLRKNDLPFHVAFQSKVGPAEWLTPSTPEKLKALGAAGHKSVLIVPIAFVTDHIETAYELDIQVRAQARTYGIEHFEVTSGLNTHPRFIGALAGAVLSRLKMPAGASASWRAARRVSRTFTEEERACRCHQCEFIAEAARWEPAPETV